MSKNVLVTVMTLAMLIGCSKKSSTSETSPAPAPAPGASVATPAAPASNDAIQKKVAELAGSGAKDCGRPSQTDRDAIDAAGKCVMDSAKEKKPFSVVYDMPGMSVGIAGAPDGKLYSAQFITPEGGAKSGNPEVSVAPCPSELRIAQSGRVTCFPAGTMGVPPGSANPHAGSGMSPHGGMGATPPGTPNPHGGTKPPAKAPTPEKTF